MRKTIVASTLALAAFAVGSEAQAAGWGLHSGETLRGGDNMLYGELGWPDFSMGFQHGMSEKVDLGIRFSLLYGFEYSTWTNVGMGLRVPIRIQAARKDKFSFLFHVDPGIKFDNLSGGLLFGIWFPLGLEFGIHITREAHLQFGMDVPFYLNLTNGVYAAIPIQLGPGFEYSIDNNMAVGINMRFGPTIGAGNGAYYGGYWGGCNRWGTGCTGAAFGFVTQLYFAYRL